MSDIFNPANTAKAVHESLEAAAAAIPKDDSIAMFLKATYKDGEAGVTAVVVGRAGHGWKWLGEFAYDGDDGPRAGVAVGWSGK